MGELLNVLIIDDSEVEASSIVAQLGSDGFRVRCRRVATEAEMRRALAEAEWNLIVSEYSLQQFGSTEALAVLEKNGYDIPFIIVTDVIDENIAVQCIRAGAYDYIAKGDRTRLVAAVERELQKRRQRALGRTGEEALRASEEKYNALFQCNPDAVYSVDPRSRFVSVNPACTALSGYTAEELTGMESFRHLLPSDEVETNDMYFKKAMEGESLRYETILVHKDGRLVECENVFIPIVVRGQVIGAHGIAKDITQRKKTDRMLAERIKHISLSAEVGFTLTEGGDSRQIVQSCADAICHALDVAFVRVWLYNETENMLELHASAGMYRHLDGAHARIPFGHRKIGKVAATRLPYFTNGVLGDPAFPDQEWARSEGMTAFAAHPLVVGNRLIGVVGMFSRKSINDSELIALEAIAGEMALGIERVRMEEARRLSEEKFRSAFEYAAIGIALISLGGRFIQVNGALCNMLGLTEEELLAKTFKELTHEDNLEADLESFKKMLACEIDSFQTEKRFLHKDDRAVWVSMTVSMVRESSGHPLFFIGQIQDITEHKKTEEEARLRQQQLIHADKMTSLGIMVTGVAHEINNPNNFIMFNVPILQKIWKDVIALCDRYQREEGDLSLGGLSYAEVRDSAPKLLNGLADGSTRIKNIVERLKDFGKQDASVLKRKLDVNEVVDISVSIIQSLLGKSTDHFGVTYGKNLPQVVGNKQELEQVVINLIANACHALDDREKRVSVRTRYDVTGHSVLIEVEDEGVGIPPENMEKIMDPFFTTKRDSGGTGLGLSVSFGIVRDHGGRIEFASEEGKGPRQA